MTDALVIGAGPAGLMAAQELAQAGRHVTLVEAKPSVGRKLLMAGKSGLNLTKAEPFDAFLPNYFESAEPLREILTGFDNTAVQNWARDLGQEVFTGSSGRVFPKTMKSSPLLRAWMVKLAGLNVQLNTRWRWQGWADRGFQFATPEGNTVLHPKVTVLALGGASWPRLGSDGAWAPWLADRGVILTPFAPANAGVRVDWSDHMARHFGAPVKGVALSAGKQTSRGEFIISKQGLEGGGIYTMSRAVRMGEALTLDLMPDWSEARILKRLTSANRKTALSNRLRKALHLGAAKRALLMEFGRPLPEGAALAHLIKNLPIKHAGLRPIDEAISTAGGVAWDALNPDLMLTAIPGVFIAGEMLNWEAPTGGYLLTACLATGKWAGGRAAKWG